MKFICDKCKTKYSIADEKVRKKVLKIRCKKCRTIIVVRDTGVAKAPARDRRRAGTGTFVVPTGPRQEAVAQQAGAHRPATETARGGLTGELISRMDEEELERTVVYPPGWLPASYHEAAAEAEPTWFMGIGGQPVGPVTLPEVRKNIAAGKVLPDSLVWKDGWPDWIEARTVELLAPLFCGPGAGVKIVPAVAPAKEEPTRVDFKPERPGSGDGWARPGKVGGTADDGGALLGSEEEIEAALAALDGFGMGAEGPTPEGGAAADGQAGPPLGPDGVPLAAIGPDGAAIPMPVPPALEEDMGLAIAIDDEDIVQAEFLRPNWTVRIALMSVLAGALVVLALPLFGIRVPGLSSDPPRKRLALRAKTNGNGTTPSSNGTAGSGAKARSDAALRALRNRFTMVPISRRRTKKKAHARPRRGGRRRIAHRGRRRGGLKIEAIGAAKDRALADLYGKAFGRPKGGAGRGKVALALGIPAYLQKRLVKEMFKHQKRLKYCYDLYLKKAGIRAEGMLKIKIVIEPTGRVSSANIVSRGHAALAVARCLKRGVAQWRFGGFTGEAVTMEVPFILKVGS